MSRRRRPPREIPFSFESFLDVVANVVGIIIRLILVAWVGARSYKAIPPPVAASAKSQATNATNAQRLQMLRKDPPALPDPTDPRLQQIAQRRQDLRHQRDAALRRYQQQKDALQNDTASLQKALAHLAAQHQEFANEQAALKAKTKQSGTAAQGVAVSVAELEKRSKRLVAELKKLEKQPRSRKQLRYHTPVSADVRREVIFECKAGRVTLFDRLALEEQAIAANRGKLHDRWEVNGVTNAVGDFRLRYVFARARSNLDGPPIGIPPPGSYQISLSWEGEPVASERGETAQQALSAGSTFRRVVDNIDQQTTAITLCVYPDSFPLYRKLRDYLHTKEVVVAGRPLPEGAPIASSPYGTR